MILHYFYNNHSAQHIAGKKLIKDVSGLFKIEEHDLSTEDGLAEALQFNAFTEHISFALVDMNHVIVQKWDALPTKEELKSFL